MFAKKATTLMVILFVLALLLSIVTFLGKDVAYAQGEEEPTLSVVLNMEWVSGRNWPVGETVVLTIENPYTLKSPDYTDSQVVEENGNAKFDYFSPNPIDFDIRTGHIVTLSTENVSVSHKVLGVGITYLDFSTNSIDGFGVPDSEVFVDIYCDPDWWDDFIVETDENGSWDINPTCDLETINYIFADQYDTPNTSTSCFWSSWLGMPPVCTPDPVVVEIDIKPGSQLNPINTKSKGSIPVAILSTPDFDATVEVDKMSLTFGRVGDEDGLAHCGADGEDVNNDRLLDLVCSFYTQSSDFFVGNTKGVLKGHFVDGTPFESSDLVKILK